MKAATVLCIGVALLASSCRENTPEAGADETAVDASAAGRPDDFSRLLRKLPIVDIPVTIDLGGQDPPYVELELAEQRLISGDASAESGVAMGILPDTSEVVHVFWLGAADSWLPTISTFTRAGELLSVQALVIGECGPDPCYRCKEAVRIGEDWQVLTTDTVHDCECDTNYTPIIGTCKDYIKVRHGIITPRGALMEPMQRVDLPGE